MVNQINGPISPSTGSASKKSDAVSTGSAENRSETPEQTPAGGDSIELSSQAQLLGRIEAQISELPEVDQERVDRIKTAIENGQYQIDNFSLAQRIIDFELG